MRVSKMIGAGVAALLLAQTFSACTVFRTPYEKAKIQENGGVVKKEASNAGSDRGASDQSGDKKKQQKAPSNAQTAAQKKGQPGKGRLLDIEPKIPSDTTAKMMYSKGLSSEVSKVEGVESSTVLLDPSHNAYVAIHSEGSNASTTEVPVKGTNSKLNVKTEGEVPDAMQKSIANRLRSADPLVQTVYITSDPHHVQTFQRYAAKSSSNQLSQLNAEAMTEHIEDIWR